MAQGTHRPRHARQQSRLMRITSFGKTPADENGTTTAKRQDAHNETLRYVKRVLCQSFVQQGALGEAQDHDAVPLTELLPPLTSSNEIDLQLYAIIAVILSNFVQTWYNRITPDQDFVAEVVQIIAHCTRGLEERLRHVDLEALALDELPALLNSHVEAVKVAKDAHPRSESHRDIRVTYASMHPSAALAPLPEDSETAAQQDENETAWSQLLVSRVLPLVLPPEDLQNSCLHVLMSELFSEMIVHRVLCQRVTEPWLLWEGITKAIYALKPALAPRRSPSSETSSPVGRLEQYGLLSSEETLSSADDRSFAVSRLDSIAATFWMALQFLTTVWLLMRSLALALMQASSLPARTSHVLTSTTSGKPSVSALEPPDGGPGPQPKVVRNKQPSKRPVVRFRIWTCISTVTAIDQRMPWLSGLLSLVQWLSLRDPGEVCRTDGALDRLLSSQIQARLFRAEYVPPLLQAIRTALFPDNALAAARVPPTADEIDEIKRVCAQTIVLAVPEVVRERFFATKEFELMRKDVEETLDLFEDQYLNKHLIIAVVELLVVRLFPELSEEGAAD